LIVDYRKSIQEVEKDVKWGRLQNRGVQDLPEGDTKDLKLLNKGKD
jgi:hypothetical protein